MPFKGNTGVTGLGASGMLSSLLKAKGNAGNAGAMPPAMAPAGPGLGSRPMIAPGLNAPPPGLNRAPGLGGAGPMIPQNARAFRPGPMRMGRRLGRRF